jgi:hypothetical protein
MVGGDVAAKLGAAPVWGWNKADYADELAGLTPQI